MKRLVTAREQAELAEFWRREAMPYYHTTDSHLAPGDDIRPGGPDSKWRGWPDYDSHQIYMWDDQQAAERIPYGPRTYEVEPFGEVTPDPSAEHAFSAPGARVVRRASVDPDLQSYLDQAQRNLMATSRTAQGTVDTSASPDKAEQMHDITGDQAATLAANNYRDVISRAYAERNRQFGSPQEVRDFVEGMAAQVNGGILKGPLLRQHDSDKYPYTRVKDLPKAADEFYTELHRRLNDPAADPVDTAAWAEYHVNPGHHFFGDGAGKTSKALSSYILMRNGLPLPTYPGGNKEYFRNTTRRLPIGQDPEDDARSFDQFRRYYRGMMPQQSQRTAAGYPPAPWGDEEQALADALQDRLRERGVHRGLTPESMTEALQELIQLKKERGGG